MRTIWKFPLKITDEQTVAMPSGAEILSVQMQGGVLTLWAVVDPDKRTKEIDISIFGTGHTFPDWLSIKQGHHLGTVQDGALVWHVFSANAG